MKLSQKQQIVEYAKAHPGGFTAAALVAHTGIKANQVARKLWELKKKKILAHNPKKHTYTLIGQNDKTIKVTAPPKDNKIKQERENAALTMLDNMLKEVQETEEKYQDALAIIRYLENKLYVVIQRDARI